MFLIATPRHVNVILFAQLKCCDHMMLLRSVALLYESIGTGISGTPTVKETYVPPGRYAAKFLTVSVGGVDMMWPLIKV